MATPEPVGFGIVGAGAIVGLSHGPAMARLAEARLVAVSDKDAARAEANGRAWGAERWYAETEALIADAAVEAVLVATPNRFHRAAVEMAAAAGKPVFCEKPLAATLTDARAMVEACNAAGVILQVGFNQRFWAQVRIAKQLIDTGFIGRVHGCRSLFAEQQGKYPAATAYRYDLAQSGGATIIDLTVHRIDLVRHLLGEFRSLTAEVRHSALAEAVDDNVWILANLQNGATVCLTSDRYGPGVKDETDIFGSEGTIHFATETLNPFHAAPLAVHTERAVADLPDVLRQAHYPGAWWEEFAGGWITLHPPRTNPYDDELSAFCAAVRDGTPPPVSGADGAKAQEVITAAYLAVNERRWVDLPLPAGTDAAPPAY